MKFDHILTTWRYRSTLFVVHWQEAHSTAHLMESEGEII